MTPGVGGVPELAAEDLHAEQRENEYEEEEDNEERGNGRDRVHQRLHQVPHRRPVSATDKRLGPWFMVQRGSFTVYRGSPL